jgi:hypothetical protein
VYLIGFRNRLEVLIDWAWKYFTSRGAGAILVEQAQDLAPDITVTDRMPAPRLPGAISIRGMVGADGERAEDTPFSADGGSRNRRPAI